MRLSDVVNFYLVFFFLSLGKMKSPIQVKYVKLNELQKKLMNVCFGVYFCLAERSEDAFARDRWNR